MESEHRLASGVSGQNKLEYCIGWIHASFLQFFQVMRVNLEGNGWPQNK
jgi:hypothetical protein